MVFFDRAALPERERGGVVVERQTPNRGVFSIPTGVTVF